MSKDIRTIIVDVGAITDERELSVPCVSGETLKLVRAAVMPATALSANDTNYLTLTVKKGAGGTSLGSFTTQATGGQALVKGTAIEFALTATGKDLEFTASNCVEFVVADAASTADFDGSVVLVFEVARVP
jgi:hypothetical protein